MASSLAAESHRENACVYDERASGRTDYYRARYYSPTTQRFISQDPIGFGGGDVNLYAMVWNNPLSFVDPLGLMGSGGVNSSTTPQVVNVFGCVGVCASSQIDGSQPPQGSIEPTLGGGIEICDAPNPSKAPCDKSKPKNCGMYDPNCDNQMQPPGVPLPTGLGFIVGGSIKSDGRICIRIGLFGEIPLIPSIDLGSIYEH